MKLSATSRHAENTRNIAPARLTHGNARDRPRRHPEGETFASTPPDVLVGLTKVLALVPLHEVLEVFQPFEKCHVLITWVSSPRVFNLEPLVSLFFA